MHGTTVKNGEKVKNRTLQFYGAGECSIDMKVWQCLPKS